MWSLIATVLNHSWFKLIPLFFAYAVFKLFGNILVVLPLGMFNSILQDQKVRNFSIDIANPILSVSGSLAVWGATKFLIPVMVEPIENIYVVSNFVSDDIHFFTPY